MPRARLALLVCAVALGACRIHHVDDAWDEERDHPVDHFMTHARFGATFHRTAPNADEAPWPAVGSTVGLVEVTCTVRETKGGRTAHCGPGSHVDAAFLATLREHGEETPPALGASTKARLDQCYSVVPRAWTSEVMTAYERALVGDPEATPPAGEDWVLAYVAYDRAPFVGKCRPEPDGTCIYRADGEAEATVAERFARMGKAAELPFTPERATLVLSFEDGHEPAILYQAGIRTNESDDERKLADPMKIDWRPVLAWYRANESKSPNFPVVLALAGELAEARALGLGGTNLTDPTYVAHDPCDRGKQ